MVSVFAFLAAVKLLGCPMFGRKLLLAVAKDAEIARMDSKSGEARARGIGVALPRKEDDRYLRGRGRYVGDIRRAGMLDMAFVRSPLAHARIKQITKPENSEDTVFANADLTGVSGIIADCALPGFRSSVQPVLASDKVRHVGEPIVACLAPTRAAAEDLAELVDIEFEELTAVAEMTTALDSDMPMVHDHWDENAFLVTSVDTAFDAAIEGAASVIKRTYRTARQCMAPIEGRGCVAEWDRQLELVTLPHGGANAAHCANRIGRVSWPRSRSGSHHFSRRWRWFWVQGRIAG